MSPSTEPSDSIVEKKLHITSQAALSGICRMHSAGMIKRDLLNSILTIRAGPEKQGFGIPKGLSRNASPSFSATFGDEATDGHETSVKWSGEQTHVIKIFQIWLYTGSIARELEPGRKWEMLVELYIFTETGHLTAFKNLIIDKPIEDIGQPVPPDIEQSELIHGELPACDPLSRFMVALTAYKLQLREGVSVPQDFAAVSEGVFGRSYPWIGRHAQRWE